jgi:hypothetical protein
MSGGAETGATERLAVRVRGLLAQPEAFVEADGAGGYVVRPSADRRRRAVLRFSEGVFRRLAQEGVLAVRAEGGWGLARTGESAGAGADRAGRPGIVLGEASVAESDGAVRRVRANLGESPVAWLLRREWLSRREAAAAQALADDQARAGVIGRLTMDWGAGPKAKGGGWAGEDPAARGLQAKARLRAALEAAGPGLREVVEAVCLRAMSLEQAERALKLPRRSGKALLKLGLERAADAYRLP